MPSKHKVILPIVVPVIIFFIIAGCLSEKSLIPIKPKVKILNIIVINANNLCSKNMLLSSPIHV